MNLKPLLSKQNVWKSLTGNLTVILAHQPRWASASHVPVEKFLLCLLQEAANWFLGLAHMWQTCSMYLLCQYYCKVTRQTFSEILFGKKWFQIQDLPFRKPVMFHQSWGKLTLFQLGFVMWYTVMVIKVIPA